MVAVHHRPVHLRSVLRADTAVRTDDAGGADARPVLRVIEGGAGTASSNTPLTFAAIVAVMATLLLVGLVRGVQGAPPAGDWTALAESSPSPVIAATPVDGQPMTYRVADDDTWASIAAIVAPGADPVEVARDLAVVNGGYGLEAGQVLVIDVVQSRSLASPVPDLASPVGD